MNINIEGERDQTSTSLYGRDFRARFFSPTVTQRSSYRHETEEGGMRDGPKSRESVHSSVLDVPLNGFLMVLKHDLLNFL